MVSILMQVSCTCQVYCSLLCYFFLLCSASQQQAIHIFNLENKDVLNNIRYHDGFRGQKIGPTKCLAFHPYKVSGYIAKPVIWK